MGKFGGKSVIFENMFHASFADNFLLLANERKASAIPYPQVFHNLQLGYSVFMSLCTTKGKDKTTTCHFNRRNDPNLLAS